MLKSERQLEAEMRALLRKAEIIDAQEDGQYGKGNRGDELPVELQRRSSRLEWIRKARCPVSIMLMAGVNQVDRWAWFC